MRSVSLAVWLQYLAKLFFALALIALPLRFRWLIQSRPMDPIYQDYTDFIFHPSDLFLILALLLWMFALLIRPKIIQPGALVISLPLALLTLAGLLSTVRSIDPSLSFYHSARLFLLACFYVYVVNEGSTKGVVLPIVAQTVLQTVIGIAQVTQQSSLGLGWVGELALDPARPGISIVWGEGQRFLRAYGLSDHPNILGGCLALGLVMIMGCYGRATKQQRGWLSMAFILTSFGLVLSFSRSAWLAFAAGGSFSILWYFSSAQKQPAKAVVKLLLLTGIMLLPLLWKVAPYLVVRLNLKDSFQTVPYEIQSLGERGLLIKATSQIMAENNMSGIGLGALPLAMRQAYPDLPVNYQPAHFALLDVAAETGLPGALGYLALMTAPWLALWGTRKRLVFTPELGAASALLLASIIIGLFDYYTWLLAPGRLWQWLIWGLWAAAYQAALHKGEYA